MSGQKLFKKTPKNVQIFWEQQNLQVQGKLCICSYKNENIIHNLEKEVKSIKTDIERLKKQTRHIIEKMTDLEDPHQKFMQMSEEMERKLWVI